MFACSIYKVVLECLSEIVFYIPSKLGIHNCTICLYFDFEVTVLLEYLNIAVAQFLTKQVLHLLCYNTISSLLSQVLLAQHL